jgi:hypothetical protein
MKTMGITLLILVVLAAGVFFMMRAKDPLRNLGAEVPPGATVGDFTLTPCTIRHKGRQLETECGNLIVPEDRTKPEGRLIALPVIRFLSTSENPAEPVFWMQGGPGATNLGYRPQDSV